MKKILSMLCVICILLSCTTVLVSAQTFTDDYIISDAEGADKESAETYAYGYIGDVDLTDSVNVKDATTIQKHAAGLLELRDTNAILADIDFSDSINVKDATAIQKWVAGISVNFPIYRLATATDDSVEHVHAYTIETKPVTCVYGGFIRYTCACGEIYTSNSIMPSGHNLGEWEIYLEPQIGIDGEERAYCSTCGDYESRIIDMLTDGMEDVITAGNEAWKIVRRAGAFETVDEVFNRQYSYGVGSFRGGFYGVLIEEGNYEIDESTGYYSFKRSDLNDLAIKVFGREYIWETFTEPMDYKAVDYYDAETDSMIVNVSLGAGSGTQYRINSCIDNGDGTYTLGVNRKEGSPSAHWTPFSELVLQKTDNGYPVVSYTYITE